MSSSNFDAAVYYINTFGWHLVPIPSGTKGPTHQGWNTIEQSINTIEKAQHWKIHPHDNMGVLLEPSGIVVLDIDNVEETKMVFETYGLDYDKLLKGCPRIRGKPDHDKAIFKAPLNTPLKRHSLSWVNRDDKTKTHTVFELRGGMVQDVLPPSIHPDTKSPYEWRVDPSDGIPKLPTEILSMWVEWDKFNVELQNICPWSEKKLTPAPKKSKARTNSDDDIIGRYNDANRVASIIERHGYKRISENRYLSPYSTTKLAGVIVFPDNKIFSHHGSEPFDTSKSHDAFDMFCHFECGGDVMLALSEAAKSLGLQTRSEKLTEHGSEVAKELLKASEPKPEDSIKSEMDEARRRCLLPPFPEIDSGLFKDYIDFGKRVSYSLHEFHFASLLTIASMAIGRKVVTKVGMTSIYPNVFTMVVGQTTISGKSVACNMAIDNFGSAITYEEPIAKCYSTNILRGTISEAALIQGMSEVYNSLWYWDDASGFFEDATTWNAHILGTMCSIYDGSVVERTLSKRSKSGEQYKWSCPFPFMSMLFNTTTKDIEQVANSRLFSSGFFPRLMWFYGQGGQPRKNEDVTEEDKVILEDIRSQIKNLRESLASLQMDSIIFGVCDIIEDWKIDVTLNRLGKEDEAFRTAISRGFIHAYKIATILTMMDRSFQKQILGSCSFPVFSKIPDKHAKMAIKIVEQYLIPRTMYVYEMCNSSDAKNHQIIVMKALNHYGGVADRTKILRQTHLGKKDLDAALSTMIESGEIKCHCVTQSDAKKPTMVIIKQ